MFFIKLMGALAVIATLCLGAVLALQIIEMQDYKAPPSVWPILPD